MTGGLSKEARDTPEAADVAAYVATLTRELKELVEPYDMKSLGYLLDLVRLEAEQCVRDHGNAKLLTGKRAHRPLAQ